VVKRLAYAIIGVILLALAGIIPAYLALGQEGGQQAAVTITARPASGSPGGGGGGSPVEVPVCPAGEVATTGRATSGGLVFQGFVIKSFDKKFSLYLNQGITVLTPDGQCPKCIGLHEMTAPPSLPEGTHLIGAGYDAVPDLTAFTPPATIIYSYDPNDIPEDVAEESLAIALSDPATGEWLKLDCVVDTEVHTITAKIGRFNDMAVLSYEPEMPTTAPTIAPTSLPTSAPEITPIPPTTPTSPPAERTPAKPFNWWPIGGVIAAAAVTTYLYRGRLSLLLQRSPTLRQMSADWYRKSINQSRRWWSRLRRVKKQ
jgi:hypothetical protein